MSDESVDKQRVIAQAQDWKNKMLYSGLFEIYRALGAARPGDKSPLDRRYAVVITKFEDILAYVEVFIMRGVNLESLAASDAAAPNAAAAPAPQDGNKA